jgi:hypothetical protein
MAEEWHEPRGFRDETEPSPVHETSGVETVAEPQAPAEVEPAAGVDGSFNADGNGQVDDAIPAVALEQAREEWEEELARRQHEWEKEREEDQAKADADLRKEQEAYENLRTAKGLEGRPTEVPDLPADISMSQLEISGLMDMAARVMTSVPYYPPGETPEKRAETRFNAEQKVAQNQREFEALVAQRILDAYTRGKDVAIDSEVRNSYRWRGVVLVLIVAAIVAMPIIAILSGLEATEFGTYMAPVTGIAGTIVGYWFGQAGREQSKPQDSLTR